MGELLRQDVWQAAPLMPTSGGRDAATHMTTEARAMHLPGPCAAPPRARPIATHSCLPPARPAGNYSNEAKLALLERRFTVPPSPVQSRGETVATSLLQQQNSFHSCSSARVQPTAQNTPTVSGRSKHTLDAGGGGESQDGTAVNQPAKRRRVQQQLPVGPPPAQQQVQQQAAGAAAAAKRMPSPPSTGQLPRPSLSPFLAGADPPPRQHSRLTPNSKQKQRNSISRYFPTVHTEAGQQQQQPGGGRSGGTSPQQQLPLAAIDPALAEEARLLRCGPPGLQCALQRVALCCAVLASLNPCDGPMILHRQPSSPSVPGRRTSGCSRRWPRSKRRRQRCRAAWRRWSRSRRTPSELGRGGGQLAWPAGLMQEGGVLEHSLQPHLPPAPSPSPCTPACMHACMLSVPPRPGRLHCREQWAQRETLVRSVMLRLVTGYAKQERQAALQRLQQAAPRLGCLAVRRKGIDVQEVRAGQAARAGPAMFAQPPLPCTAPGAQPGQRVCACPQSCVQPHWSMLPALP